MTEFTTEFMSGKIYWAKVFRAVDNYDRDGKEWTYNFVPDESGIQILKQHRLLDRLKEAKAPITEDFLVLKKPERNKDGEKNDPIIVKTPDNEDWDVDEHGLIGNGSSVDVKLTIADFGKGKKKAIWTSAIRVTEQVKFEGGTQASNRDPFADFTSTGKAKPDKATKAKKEQTKFEEFDLDDDAPF